MFRRALASTDESTATHDPAVDTSSAGHFSPRLALEDLRPSPTNPRTHFSEAYLTELAGSVRDKGVMQPIVVRPIENGGPSVFEIVLGECRYRASKLAGKTTIPALVRELQDDEVRELQLVENIHRKDLTAMEEARGYRGLIDSNPTKHNAESIAGKIGMSVSYVWDRLKLNDLIPEAQQILEAERMTVGHAILIARQTPENQARIIDREAAEDARYGQTAGLWQTDNAIEFDDDKADQARQADEFSGVKPVSVRELERWITEHIRFDVEHAAKAQPLQFEQTAAVVEEAKHQPGRGKKVISITREYRVADDARDEKERTYGSQSWRLADGTEKSKTCDHSVLGVVVAGEGYGDTLQVCVARDKCQVHFGKEIKEREKNAKLRATGKSATADKREKASTDRDKLEREKREAERKAWDRSVPHVAKAFAAHVAGVKFSAELVRNVLASYQLEQVGKRFGIKLTDKTAAQVLVLAAAADEFWSRSSFITHVKPWKFDVAAVEKTLSPDAPKAAAKSTKKSGLKKTA